MSKHVLFFHPYQFLPAKAGNYRRSLQMLCALREMGHRVTVVSVASNWNIDAEAKQAIADAAENLRLLEMNRTEETWLGRFHRAYDILHAAPPAWLVAQIKNGRRQLSRIIDEVAPDYLYVTYMMADEFVDHARYPTLPRIIDTIDLITLNNRMWRQLEPHLGNGPLDPMRVDPDILTLDYWPRQRLTAEPEEYATYDRYSQTIAIVTQEADSIRQHTQRTTVHTIPPMQAPISLQNTYAGDAFLPSGPNPFNIQGLLFFAKHVLPRVRTWCPDFCLHVAGPNTEKILPQEGLRITPFIDVKDGYRTAPFLVCAAFGGTGQQVKITEAMAHGVPVVAPRSAAERSCVRHRENGLIADSAEEFAEHILTLWNDRALCRQLGECARHTVATELSDERLLRSLSTVLDSAAGGPPPQKPALKQAQ